MFLVARMILTEEVPYFRSGRRSMKISMNLLVRIPKNPIKL